MIDFDRCVTPCKGGRRMTSKNCDFCNFSKKCEKLEKSQFLVKFLNWSGKGGRKVPRKNCGFCNFCDYYHDKELRKIATNVKNCQSCDFSLHTKILQFLLLRANLDISETCGSVSSTFIKLDQKVFQGHTIIYVWVSWNLQGLSRGKLSVHERCFSAAVKKKWMSKYIPSITEMVGYDIVPDSGP